jgi:hypothetical protein
VALCGLVGSSPTPSASDADLTNFTQTYAERRSGVGENPRQTNELKVQNLNESERIIVEAENMEFTVFESHPLRKNRNEKWLIGNEINNLYIINLL